MMMRRSVTAFRHITEARLPTITLREPTSPAATLQMQRLSRAGILRCFSDFLRSTANDGNGPGLRLTFAGACLPHPDKAKRGGEDGYFACPRTQSFGVADGVGGWIEAGVDPGEFARGILRFAHKGIDQSVCGRQDRTAEADLHKILLESWERLAEEQLQGGTTAVLGQLNGSDLCVLNLGDSGVMVLRPATRKNPFFEQMRIFPRVMFRSSDQTHYFNCPYQLSSGGRLEDVPDFARIRVRAGDLVIAATDGVFDNLFDHHVQSIVARHLANAWQTGSEVGPLLQGLAKSIVDEAQNVGFQHDKDLLTPFMLSAHSEGRSHQGGKLDDTTAVVGVICEVPRTSDCPDTGAANEGKQPSDGLPLLHNFC
eukprot:TRINITY_DN55904_c0_g1_i1.p1 TRINITY_DN55904_c0_g1~~TRINITY_DN55904_c0_g1_i1.p1  ORF type:complete len:369 (-),score=46.77 TRINITY_DN55904_c0_g1_i1:121-1227(-)